MALLAQGEARTIVVNPSGPPSNTLTAVLPPGVTISLESVLAAIDASGAGDTTALLEIADSSGAVIARKAQGQVVTGGQVGSATWALRLDDEAPGSGGDVTVEHNGVVVGTEPAVNFNDNIVSFFVTDNPAHGRVDVQAVSSGIRFSVDNQGGYLYVQTNSSTDLDRKPDPLSVGGRIGTAIEDNSGKGLLIGSNLADTTVKARGGSIVLLADSGGGLGGAGIFLFANQQDINSRSNNATIQLSAIAGKLTVLDRNGNQIFRVDQSGALHGKAGQALTFDL